MFDRRSFLKTSIALGATALAKPSHSVKSQALETNILTAGSVWHIKSTGTRAITAASSIEGVWTDENCYPPSLFAELLLLVNGSDNIIFYDENDGVTLVEYVLPAGMSTYSASGLPGSVTIRSRSGDSRQCSLKSDDGSIAGLVTHNNNVAAMSYLYKGLTFVGPNGGYEAGGWQAAFISVTGGEVGDLIFEDCVFGHIELRSPMELLGGLILSDENPRELRLINCIFEDISSLNFYGGCWLGRSGATFRVMGSLMIRNVAVTATHGITYGFRSRGDSYLEGPVTVEQVHNHAAPRQLSSAAILTGPGYIESIHGVVIQDCSNLGGRAGAIGIKVQGPYRLANVVTRRITVRQDPGENSLGAGVLFMSAEANGDLTNVITEDVVCFSGGGIYYSNGAGGTLSRITCRRVDCGEHGAVYSGGDGDIEIDGLFLERCRSGVAGGGFFAHVHPENGLRNKSVVLRNVSILDCEGNNQKMNYENLRETIEGSGNAIYINNDNPSFALQADISNLVVKGASQENIVFGSSTGNLTAQVSNCDVEGGEAAIVDGTYGGSVSMLGITSDPYHGWFGH